jgi:hypothetical protein
VAAAGLAALLARTLIPDVPPLLGLLTRGTLTVLVFAAVLWMTGFLRQSERAVLVEIERRWRTRARVPDAAEP